jgi:hypothetical protein
VAGGGGSSASAHHCRYPATSREEEERYPELLLDIARDETDDAKQHDEDLKCALAVELSLEVLQGVMRTVSLQGLRGAWDSLTMVNCGI